MEPSAIVDFISRRKSLPTSSTEHCKRDSYARSLQTTTLFAGQFVSVVVKIAQEVTSGMNAIRIFRTICITEELK